MVYIIVHVTQAWIIWFLPSIILLVVTGSGCCNFKLDCLIGFTTVIIFCNNQMTTIIFDYWYYFFKTTTGFNILEPLLILLLTQTVNFISSTCNITITCTVNLPWHLWKGDERSISLSAMWYWSTLACCTRIYKMMFTQDEGSITADYKTALQIQNNRMTGFNGLTIYMVLHWD